MNNTIIKQLDLDESFNEEIDKFLKNVSMYKLVPYINLIKNTDVFDKLKKVNPQIQNK